MTHSSSRRQTPRSPKSFDYYPGTDGVDETFDIICHDTNQVVASFHFWTRREQCRRAARQLVAALNALYDNGGDLRIDEFVAAHRHLERKYQGFHFVPGEDQDDSFCKGPV